MKESQKQAITNMLASATDDQADWLRVNTNNSNIQRPIFKQLVAAVNNFQQNTAPKQWFIMPGLRGIGKSTVLTQLYLDLPLDNSYKFFLALDRVKFLGATMVDVVAVLEELVNERLEALTKPVYIFMDEVQYLPDWALGLKILFDRIPKIFIVCTGSSAIKLQTNPDVLRRSTNLPLHPLDFKEYVAFRRHYAKQNPISPAKNLNQQIQSALFEASDCQSVFRQLQNLKNPVDDYWQTLGEPDIWQTYMRFGSLPLVIKSDSPIQSWSAIDTLLNEPLIKDITNFTQLNGSTIETLPTLLRLLAESDVISTERISKITSLNKRTVISLLKALGQTAVLNPIRPLGSMYRQVNRPSKYLFTSPAIRLTLIMKAGIADEGRLAGKLMEDMIGLYLKRLYPAEFVYYDAKPAGADFIVVDPLQEQSAVAVEVGLNKRRADQTSQTLDRTSGKYGLVISNTELKINLSAKTVFVPLEYFLLL